MSKVAVTIPLTDKISIDGNIPFNVAQPTPRSIILRQVEFSHAAFNSLTIELFQNGSARLYLPFPFLPALPDAMPIESPHVREVFNRIRRGSMAGDVSQLRFFDVEALILHLTILISFYKHWLGDLPPIFKMEVAASLTNVWRAVPFLDSDEWGKHVQRYGLPVVGSKQVWVGLSKGEGLRIPWGSDAAEWQVLSGFIFLGFGMPVNAYASSLATVVWKASQKS